MLLVPQVFQFTFDLQSYKILQIQPANDNTFVLLVIQKQLRFEQILHVTSTGHIINRYSVQSTINYIVMISPYQVATTMVQSNCVMVLNLAESAIQKIAHVFNKQAIDDLELYTFPLSSLFCIFEYSVHTRNNLRLTYFSQNKKQIELCYEQQSYQLQNLMITSKSNNYSQIAWYLRNYKEKYEEIILHDIVTNHNSQKESRVRKIRIKDITFINYSNSANELLNIRKIWRLRQHQYLLLPSPIYTQHGNYVWDCLVFNQVNKTIRTSHFHLPIVEKQIVVNVQLGEEFTLFVTHRWQIPGQLPLMNYYLIDNRTEKLIKNIQARYEDNQKNFQPSYEFNTLIKAQYQREQNKVKLLINKIFRISQIHLHFLLAINDNFDDDLLQDSLQLINSDKQI